MEAFQGKYKDITNGSHTLLRDCCTVSVFWYSISYDNFVWLTTAVVLASTSLFFSNARPYKEDHSNTFDGFWLC